MAKIKLKRNTIENVLINIGIFDIPTGMFITGNRGESIINGGLDVVSGVIGPGNSYKSTIIHYMMVTAADRVKTQENPAMHTYDTEMNVKYARLKTMAQFSNNLSDDILDGDDPDWSVVTKADYSSDEWLTSYREMVNEKAKEKPIEYTAFKDPYTKEVYKNKYPSFVEIDSFTEFESSASMDMLSKSKKDNNDTATYYLRDGLFKSKFMGEQPRLTRISNTNLLITAHIGQDKDIGGSKYSRPEKDLQFMKSEMKVKGSTGKFNYLLLTAWYAHTASVLKNQATKLPEYPRKGMDTQETDLNTVKLTLLRSKSGPSGTTMELVVSQVDGILMPLSYFQFIKVNGKYGFLGNDRNYSLCLMPELSLSRTKIRDELDKNYKLQRTVEILAQLLQMEKYMSHYKGVFLCDPLELYTDIIKMGYDWDTLLNTRGWWTIDQYRGDYLPFLSVLDLLKMRLEGYHPYWLEKDKVTVKAKWKSHFEKKD